MTADPGPVANRINRRRGITIPSSSSWEVKPIKENLVTAGGVRVTNGPFAALFASIISVLTRMEKGGGFLSLSLLIPDDSSLCPPTDFITLALLARMFKRDVK